MLSISTVKNIGIANPVCKMVWCFAGSLYSKTLEVLPHKKARYIAVKPPTTVKIPPIIFDIAFSIFLCKHIFFLRKEKLFFQ